MRCFISILKGAFFRFADKEFKTIANLEVDFRDSFKGQAASFTGNSRR